MADFTYFLEQMVNLLHAPIRICNENGAAVKVSSEGRAGDYLSGEQELLQILIGKRSSEYPVIYVEDELVFAIVTCELPEKQMVIVGPVLMGRPGPEILVRLQRKYKMGAGSRIAVCTADTFVSGILLIFYEMTGKTISATELWDKNKNSYERVQQMEARTDKDLFRWHEEFMPHNPYEQEMREQESIRHGDEEALGRSMSETYEGSIGLLAREPLRHHKNVAVGNITLASRSAIQGGLGVEQSFSMADSFIQQVEELDNIPEVEAFKREAKLAYARAVYETNEKKKNGLNNENKNPLIREVKDYIYGNLHKTMKVSEIADHFHVNADYLSHLFSVQEHMTLKRYIQEEKIRRSKNLLKYSEYSIQDIGFYLGFSSQSHFTRIFREITGMNPNEYRKQYGKKDEWKIK